MSSRIPRVLLAVCLTLSLSACGTPPEAVPAGTSSLPAASSEEALPTSSEAPPVLTAQALFPLLRGQEFRRPVTTEFLEWVEAEHPGFLEEFHAVLLAEGYSDGLFRALTGSTLTVLYDLYTGAPDRQDNLHIIPTEGDRVTIAFTGDINLADDWETMLHLRRQENGLTDCIGAGLLDSMRSADLLLVNNEFSFSDRGAPLPGKLYTFRADPANVALLQAMGVDIAGLANNHVYDYGEEAFGDTLDTLDRAGIVRIGAGRSIAEASRPQYFIIGGRKIAFVAATRAEKFILTPEAGESSSGVLRTYDPEAFLQVIREADAASDLVIAYVHWGTENTTRLEDAQLEQGAAYIAAGADLVVGAHPHCLQGVGWLEGKPIFYSLGNFWFNTNTVDTALLRLTLGAEEEDITYELLPCVQRGGRTAFADEDASARILEHLRALSPDTAISPEGVVTQTAEDPPESDPEGANLS